MGHQDRQVGEGPCSILSASSSTQFSSLTCHFEVAGFYNTLKLQVGNKFLDRQKCWEICEDAANELRKGTPLAEVVSMAEPRLESAMSCLGRRARIK